MKPVAPLFALGCVGLVLGAASPTDAQIRENDSSVATLAIHCAVSSGYSPQGYEDYCRRLAKTLSLLSGPQQTRVFGYLPMTSGSLGNDTPSNNPSSPAPRPSESGTTGNQPTGDTGTTDPEENTSETPGNTTNEDGTTGNPTSNQGPTAYGNGGTSNPVGNSNPGFLVDLVKELNHFIDGTAETAAPIIGGIVPSDGNGTAGDGTTASTDPLAQTTSGNRGTGSKPSPWDALLGWLREAEDAVKGGVGSLLGGGKN